MATSADIMMPGEAQNLDYGASSYGDPLGPMGVLMLPLTDEEGTPNEENEKKVAEANYRLWRSKDQWIARDLCQWKVNSARRRGIAGAKVLREDDDTFIAWFPLSRISPDLTPNDGKLATLCRRFRSVMWTDPPAPQVEPPSGDDDDEDAAEFAERALNHLQSSEYLGTIDALQDAFDRASEFASGFVHWFADPQGGGRVPIEVEASMEAQTAEDALSPFNPMTGMPWAPPFVPRFVTQDGRLTDDEAEAAQKWAPRLKLELLDGRHVRPIPHTARDIADAEGVQIGQFLPWSVIKKWNLQDGRTVGDLPEEAAKAIRTFRPKHKDDLMPAGRSVDDDFEGNIEEHLCWTIRTYIEQCPDYPDGVHLLTLCDKYVVHRDSWVQEQDGIKRKAIVPVAQISQFKEGRTGFYRVALAEILGGPHETRATQIMGWIDHLEQINKRKTFLPLNSAITAEQLQNPQASVLYMNPGGQPFYQDVPDWPNASKEMYAEMGDQMDRASGVNEEPVSNADSGRAKYAEIAQIHAGLAEPRQAIERAYTRACRIELMLARMFLTAPQQMKWQSEGGRYKHERWMGSDLLDTYDVRIKAGTLTMLSWPAKQQLREHLFGAMRMFSPEEMREQMTTDLGPILGWQDDEFRNRIRGQIAEWKDGPPDGWQPAQPVPVPDPMTGQITMQPQLDPVQQQLWEPVQCDSLPHVAQIRFDALARLMSSPVYRKYPQPWRFGVDMEYARMQQVVQQAQMAQMAAGAQPGGEQQQQAPAQPRKNTPTNEAATADRMREGVPPELTAA